MFEKWRDWGPWRSEEKCMEATGSGGVGCDERRRSTIAETERSPSCLNSSEINAYVGFFGALIEFLVLRRVRMGKIAAGRGRRVNGATTHNTNRVWLNILIYKYFLKNVMSWCNFFIRYKLLFVIITCNQKK